MKRTKIGYGFFGLLFGFTALLTVYPVAMLLIASFWDAPPGTKGSSLTLEAFRRAYSDAGLVVVLWNSIWLATLKVLIGGAGGIFIGWVVSRTDVPFRRWIEILTPIPYYIPGILMTIAWAILANPQNGTVNRFFMWLLRIDQPIFNIYSMNGVVFNTAIHSVPFFFLLTVGAFYAMDPSLEESARMSGSSRLGVLFRITLPLMMPAILGASLLSFIRGLESFEAPLFYGSPAGIYFFSNKIYDVLRLRTPPDYGAGVALSVIVTVISFFLIALHWRLLRGKEFFTISGRGYNPRRTKLGVWRWPVAGVCALYFLLAVVLPLSQLLAGSVFQIFGYYRLDQLTLGNYWSVLTNEIVQRAMRNSLILAVVGGGLCMLLATLIAYVSIRTRYRGGHLLELVAMLPWTLPGIVLAVGILWAYLAAPGLSMLYGTLALLLLAYITKELPLGLRAMAGTVGQITPDLEESSRVSGGSWFQTFYRVMLPLLRPGFVAGWVLLAAKMVYDLSTSVLLYSHGSEVLSIALFQFWSEGQTERVAALCMILLATLLVFIGLERVLRREDATEMKRDTEVVLQPSTKTN